MDNNKRATIETFDSMESFYKYLCDTPFNKAFRWESHASVENGYNFTQTKNFEEAVELMRNGWDDMASELTQKLKVATQHDAPVMKQRNVLSVQGYQPVVPLYLAGVPTNMISKQLVPAKSKVVNVTKSVDYSSSISTNTIVRESIKAMQIVKKLEAQGCRCNLFVAIGSVEKNTSIFCKVKVKNANERLNVSKLAFPMVHPSMLRRLFFRFIEVHPSITREFVGGYGRPSTFGQLKTVFPNDIALPAKFETDIDKITNLESLKASV